VQWICQLYHGSEPSACAQNAELVCAVELSPVSVDTGRLCRYNGASYAQWGSTLPSRKDYSWRGGQAVNRDGGY